MASPMAGNSRRLPMNWVTSTGKLFRWQDVSAVTFPPYRAARHMVNTRRVLVISGIV